MQSKVLEHSGISRFMKSNKLYDQMNTESVQCFSIKHTGIEQTAHWCLLRYQ